MGSEFCPLSLGWISPLQSSHTSTSSTTPLFLLKQPQPRAVRPKMAIPPEVEARLGPAKDLEGLSDADLKAVLKEYYDRWVEAESQKYDVNATFTSRTCKFTIWRWRCPTCAANSSFPS